MLLTCMHSYFGKLYLRSQRWKRVGGIYACANSEPEINCDNQFAFLASTERAGPGCVGCGFPVCVYTH